MSTKTPHSFEKEMRELTNVEIPDELIARADEWIENWLEHRRIARKNAIAMPKLAESLYLLVERSGMLVPLEDTEKDPVPWIAGAIAAVRRLEKYSPAPMSNRSEQLGDWPAEQWIDWSEAADMWTQIAKRKLAENESKAQAALREQAESKVSKSIVVRRNGADKTNQRYKDTEDWCIENAKEIWAANPSERIGWVSKVLWDGLKTTELWKPKKPRWIHDCLTKARKEELIVISEAARIPGPEKG